ncbi:UNVERIFIED_ORG: transposase [Bacillus sp. B2I3]|nr:transposase [Bacillus sp. B2I3]
MVNCRKFQKLYFEGDSQRTISISTGHSKNTVSDVVHHVKKLGIESLNDTMTNPWLEAFQLSSETSYLPDDFSFIVSIFLRVQNRE